MPTDVTKVAPAAPLSFSRQLEIQHLAMKGNEVQVKEFTHKARKDEINLFFQSAGEIQAIIFFKNASELQLIWFFECMRMWPGDNVQAMKDYLTLFLKCASDLQVILFSKHAGKESAKWFAAYAYPLHLHIFYCNADGPRFNWAIEAIVADDMASERTLEALKGMDCYKRVIDALDRASERMETHKSGNPPESSS